MKYIDKQRTGIWLWLSIYIGTVIYIYISLVSPLFSYAYLTTDINEQKCYLCFLLLLFTLYFLPLEFRRPSSYLFYIIYLITYIPTLMYTWMNNMDELYIIYFTICILMIEIMITKIKDIYIPFPYGRKFFLAIFILYIVLSIMLVVINGGINPNALVISEISATRAGINSEGAWGYLLNWCAKSFSPVFFAYFAYKKRWYMVGLVCVLQALLYLSYGFKSFLFSIVLLVLVSLILRENEKYFKQLPKIFAGINIVSYVLYELDVFNLPMFTFAYRTLFVPAQAQYQYFDYFSTNEYLFFSEGIIGQVLGVAYPYSMPIGFIVNQSVYGIDHFSNGNTGMFSYGFADFGLVGMIIASLLLILVFLIIDGITSKVPIYIIVAAMAYQMIILNDTNILISLNTGGIVWTVFILLILGPVLSKNNEGAANKS